MRWSWSNLQEYPVRLLRRLLETYSPSGSESDLASLIKSETESLGFRSRIDEAGNVISEIGAEGPELLLCGHMDTVPGEIEVKSENGFLCGRGAVDAKSSLAAMILGSSKALRGGVVPLRAKVACVVKEETTSEGFRTILRRGPNQRYVIFGEPSGTTGIIIGYKGRIQVNIDCMTKGGHASSPWLSKNSAEEAYTFWTVLRESQFRNESGSKFNNVTCSLTRISTAGPENSIPPKTRITIDIRLPPEADHAQIVLGIRSLAEAYSEKNPGVRLEVTVNDSTPAYISSPHSELATACRGAIRKITGRSATMLKKTGTSDMNLLPAGTAAIAYGPGDSSLDHTDSERVSISEFLQSIDVFSETIKLFSRLATTHVDLPA